MQKAMFNDHLGLTQAVIDEIKQLTRRAVNLSARDLSTIEHHLKHPYSSRAVWKDGYISVSNYYGGVMCKIRAVPRYKVGEVVAVAQSYDKIYKDLVGFDFINFYNGLVEKLNFKGVDYLKGKPKLESGKLKGIAGWFNKMFTRSDLMPHKIKILSVRVEKLKDISDADCLREGIFSTYETNPQVFGYEGTFYQYMTGKNSASEGFNTPKEAFASLIDKVGKKGDWDKNPYVWVYEFELIK